MHKSDRVLCSNPECNSEFKIQGTTIYQDPNKKDYIKCPYCQHKLTDENVLTSNESKDG